jgi:hypothetical protein
VLQTISKDIAVVQNDCVGILSIWYTEAVLAAVINLIGRINDAYDGMIVAAYNSEYDEEITVESLRTDGLYDGIVALVKAMDTFKGSDNLELMKKLVDRLLEMLQLLEGAKGEDGTFNAHNAAAEEFFKARNNVLSLALGTMNADKLLASETQIEQLPVACEALLGAFAGALDKTLDAAIALENNTYNALTLK